MRMPVEPRGFARSKWRRPCQPHLGARVARYRCFLPDLAEFADYRREGTNRATIDLFGGEGRIRTLDTGISRILPFQACSLNHSDSSPHSAQSQLPVGIVRPVLGLTLRCRSGPACGGPNSFRTNLSNPRYGYKPYTHFPGVLLKPLGHLSTPCR